MRRKRVSTLAAAAVILASAACRVPRLGPDGPLEVKIPLTLAARAACRGPLRPGLTLGPGGLVLIVTRNGLLQAVRPEKGEVAWTVLLGAGAPDPVVAGDRVVLARINGRVTAVGADGREAWSVKFDRPIADGFALTGGRVVLRTAEGVLTALNPADGTTAWTAAVPSTTGWTADAERVVLRTTGGRLLVFRNDGTPAGDFAVGGTAAGDIGLAGNVALLGFADGSLGAYDLRTGRRRWRQRFGGAPVGRPASDGRVVHVVLSNQILAAFHLRRGNLLYWKPLTGRAAFAPRLVGSTVFVASRSARLQAFAAKEGTAKVAFEAGGDLLGPPELLGPKLLVLTNGETQEESFLLSLWLSPPVVPAAPAKTDAEKPAAVAGEIKK